MSGIPGIFLRGGILGMVVWGLMLSLNFAGVLCGRATTTKSSKKEHSLYPLSVKLHLVVCFMLLVTGAVGFSLEYINVFVSFSRVLGTCAVIGTPGWWKNCFHDGRSCFYVGFCSFLLQAIYMVVSTLIAHSRWRYATVPQVTLFYFLRHIPAIGYVAAAMAVPMLSGVVFSFWFMEANMVRRLDQPVPSVLGLDSFMVLNVLLACTLAGLVPLFLLMLRMTITHLRTPSEPDIP